MITFRVYVPVCILIFIASLHTYAPEERNLLSNYTQAALNKVLLMNNNWVAYPRYSDREAWKEIPEYLRKDDIKEGEKFLNYTWSNVNAVDYLEFDRSGDREVMQAPHRERQHALEALVMAELMEGEGRFIDDIVNGVWDFCEMTYWGLSAHLYLQEAGPGLPGVNESTIDLGVGRIGTDLAWTYYFLKDEFDKINPLIKSFFLPGTQIAGVRENEGSTDGFYFAAKGGHNAESHNHNDVGTFILYCDGEPAIVDVGGGMYTRKTFSPQRYEIWTMQSLYHNLPMINESQQQPGKEFAARSVNFSDKGKTAKFSVNIAVSYF